MTRDTRAESKIRIELACADRGLPKSGKCDLAAELGAAYASVDALNEAVAVRRDTDEIKTDAARTTKSHEWALAKLLQFLACTLPGAKFDEKLEVAQQAVAKGQPLPTVAVLCEFLEFYAKGSSTVLAGNESGRMTLTSLSMLRRHVVYAVSRLFFSQSTSSTTSLLTGSHPLSSNAPPVSTIRRRTARSSTACAVSPITLVLPKGS